MLFRNRKSALFLLSVLSLSLSACGPTNTGNPAPNTPSPSVQPTLSPVSSANPSASPSLPADNPAGEPTPSPIVTPVPNPSAGSSASVTLPNGTRLVVSLSNRFLTSKGQSAQLNAQLLDASGKVLPLSDLQLLFSSSRLSDFSITDSGLVTALKESGYSQLTVSVAGTELATTQLISVDTFVGGSFGGGGNVQPTPSPIPSPTSTPVTQVNANINFESLGIGEFPVSASFSDLQKSNAAVAMSATGAFVTVWEMNDGDRDGVYGQRYNAAGMPQGSEFQVNTYTVNNQDDPAVAMDARGNFVVTWESEGQDESGGGVYAQRYHADGTVNGSEFQVNTYTDNDQDDSAVAMNADGAFVVTWESKGQGKGSVDQYEKNSVNAQRYHADGTPNGSEFRVNNNNQTSNNEDNPAVAINDAGDFVISWEIKRKDDTPSTDYDTSEGIYARIYSAGGTVAGTAFLVNTNTGQADDEKSPVVAMSKNGTFAVTWTYGPSDFDIYGQRYNASGGTVGPAFRVNTYTDGDQEDVSMEMSDDGSFVVSWKSEQQDGDQNGVYAQRYNAAGVAQGSEFRVNTYTDGDQENPAVAMNKTTGDFVFVWDDDGQDLKNIYAKQYTANGRVK